MAQRQRSRSGKERPIVLPALDPDDDNVQRRGNSWVSQAGLLIPNAGDETSEIPSGALDILPGRTLYTADTDDSANGGGIFHLSPPRSRYSGTVPQTRVGVGSYDIAVPNPTTTDPSAEFDLASTLAMLPPEAPVVVVPPRARPMYSTALSRHTTGQHSAMGASVWEDKLDNRDEVGSIRGLVEISDDPYLATKTTASSVTPWFVASMIDHEFLPELLREVLSEAQAELVRAYMLKEKGVPLSQTMADSPEDHATEKLLDEVIRHECEVAVREVIAALVDNILTQSRAQSFFEVLLTEVISEILQPITAEELKDHEVYATSAVLLDEVIPLLTREVMDDALTEIGGQIREGEFGSVQRVARGRGLDRLILDHLVSQLQKRCSPATMADATTRAADSLILANILKHIPAAGVALNARGRNLASTMAHNALVADVALGALCARLTPTIDAQMKVKVARDSEQKPKYD